MASTTESAGVDVAPPAQVLSRLVDGDTGKCVYLLTGREEAGLRLVACEDSRTWSVLLTTANFSVMARQVGVEAKEFTGETERALTGQPRATEHFVYSMAQKPQGLQLTWKRHLLPGNIKFQLGSVVLEEEESGPNLGLILNHAVTSTHCLQEKICKLQRHNLQLAQEQKIALKRLEQSTQNKEEIEKELFSKFKLVLNEKKNKIRRLMEELATPTTGTELEEAAPTTTTPPRQSPPTSKPSETLLGEPDGVVSPPTKRRKREARCRGTKEPDIPKPPTISCPQTSEKNKRESRNSSSTDGEDLLCLL